ncbi:MAG TPA: aconitate hydratase AcnA, partial [Steroidobacteraceae bacterium]|nr:aconitate hydratase AcnA [Steroidobacteraceae bacterium]
MTDSFQTLTTLPCNQRQYQINSLNALATSYDIDRLPYSLKILLENLLRFEDGINVTRADIEALLKWNPTATPDYEISFTPSRVIMQDFTGVPVVVDLAAMRDAMVKLGGSAGHINPLSPAELVIDHSVQVDKYGTADSLKENTAIEFSRNAERYAFLRWGQTAFQNFKVVPPNTGIVHQVNIEYLARVIFDVQGNDKSNNNHIAYPDTVVGTDSHTTMVNGLGVLGWGVGGIEAEAAMLGQPVTMLIPQVIGFKLNGQLPSGSTATDLVLTITEMLRKHGVVDKFVEFFGDGLSNLPLADRATISNMSPEFGSTCAIFPIDRETLRYLELTGRSAEQLALIEAYAKHQHLWRENGQRQADYTAVLELDLTTVEPSIAGPKRPQDRVPLRVAKENYLLNVKKMIDDRAAKAPTATGAVAVTTDGKQFMVRDGSVLIAAITSCTNTSNPAVMLAAGLLARKARAKGITSKPWVKTSLAPGSRVVTDYLEKAKLLDDLDAIGFYVVGYGCTTCIGNSGPLKPEISNAVKSHDLVGCAVLSGNRNFEGRVHPEVKMNYLASPPLVVAYALAGSLEVDLNKDPLGNDAHGKPVYLKDIWPTPKEVQDIMTSLDSAMFKRSYASVYTGDTNWNNIQVPQGQLYQWDDSSTYVKHPPYFEDMTMQLTPAADIHGARALALLGDSVTT